MKRFVLLEMNLKHPTHVIFTETPTVAPILCDGDASPILDSPDQETSDVDECEEDGKGPAGMELLYSALEL